MHARKISLTHIRTMILVGTFLALSPATATRAQETETENSLETPESWSDFVQSTVTLGSWKAKGVTEPIWEGIPGGLAYTSTEHWHVDETKQRIIQRHVIQTDDGKVISTGGGSIYWDEETSKVVADVSGFDTGKPYYGHSVYLGFDPETKTEHWSHTETSRGTTKDYNIQRSLENINGVTSTFQPSEGGTPWIVEAQRINPLAEALANVDMLGTWTLEVDGKVMQREHVESILDGRAIRFKMEKLDDEGNWVHEGLGIMTWDYSRQAIVTRGISQNGFSYETSVLSINTEGDAVKLVIEGNGHGPNGAIVSARITETYHQDELTVSFIELQTSILEDKPVWANAEKVWTRLDR